MKELFWTLLSASKDGDPSDPADEPGTTYTVELAEGTSFIICSRRGESESVGRIEHPRHRDTYRMELQTNVLGQRSRLTYQDLDFTGATEVLVSFLQRKDEPYVPFDQEPPGERVLSGAFGQLVASWREYPEEPAQLHLENWRDAATGALVAETVANTWSRSPEACPVDLTTKIGLDLTSLGAVDGHSADVFDPGEMTGPGFVREMKAVTGTCPPSVF